MRKLLRAAVLGVALGACQGGEPPTAPEALGPVSYDPAFDVGELPDGGDCPDVYYEHSETLENGATVTWTSALAGFDYATGDGYVAEVLWSVSDGSATYAGFTGRNGNNTWTPKGGRDPDVDGTMTPGTPAAGSVPVTITMDPMKDVGNANGDDDPEDWAGAFGTGHFWLLLDVENGEGETESVKLGVNIRLEDPAEGYAARCPGSDAPPVAPPPPPPAPTPTYTVGGDVTGLTGTVLLRNNGGDDLSVSADGSFTFATALTDGATYEVTVGTQPTGQTCSVTNGTGTIAGADVTDVAVSCADDPPSTTVSYASDVQPYFDATCTGCHSGNNPPAGVHLTSYADVMAGGSGGPIVVVGDPDASALIQQLEGGHRGQSAANIAMLRAWISDGAANN